MWLVQISKNADRYTTKYSLSSRSVAMFYYTCLNVHSGYNKRLVSPDGSIVMRERTA